MKLSTKLLAAVVAGASSLPYASADNLRKLSDDSDDVLSTGPPGALGSFNVAFAQGGGSFPVSDRLGKFPNGINIPADGSLCAGCIPVDLWYPTTSVFGDTGIIPNVGVFPASYTIVDPTSSIPLPITLTNVVSNAFPVPGPLPLFVFSHGRAGVSFEHIDLFKRLASHGVVVAAVSHLGDTAADLLACFAGLQVQPPNLSACTLDDFDFFSSNPPDPSPAGPIGPTTVCNRAKDVRDVIEYMTSQFQPLLNIDPDKIAVGGHSLGGATALTTAFGVGDLSGGVCDYSPVSQVKGVIPMATASAETFSASELDSVTTPALFLSSKQDLTTPVDLNVDPIFPSIKCANEDSVRVDLENGGHNSYTDLCPGSDFYDGIFKAGALAILAFLISFAVEGCPSVQGAPTDLTPIDRAHEITGSYAVSFLKYIFGEDSYKEFLEEDYDEGIFNEEVAGEIDDEVSIFIDEDGDGECDSEE